VKLGTANYLMSTMASLVYKLRPLTKTFQALGPKQLSSSSGVKLCQNITDSKQDLGKCTKEHDETIYQGILSTQIKLVKGFSLMTSAIGIGCQPILLFNMQQNSANIAVMAGAGAFLSFFTFATPILIHQISKKYVTQLNYNKLEDTYTAMTYSFFLRRKEIKFKLKDVQQVEDMFTTFRAKNVPLFVDGQQFYAPVHYGKIMGYDKPYNYKPIVHVDDENKSEEENKQKRD